MKHHMAAILVLAALAAQAQAAGASKPDRHTDEAFQMSKSIFSFSNVQAGVIQNELSAAGAAFSHRSYDTVIFNVGALDEMQLVQKANEFMNAGKVVVLDSDGSDKMRERVSKVTGQLAGMNIVADGMRLSRNAKGVNSVTPIFATPAKKAATSVMASKMKSAPAELSDNTPTNVILIK